MTQEEIDQMTGAANLNRPQLTRHKAIRLNGKTGKFIVTHLDKDKVKDAEGNERYEQEEIADPLSVVFLKVRRRLMQGSQNDGIVKYTNEHDTVNDVVTLHIKDKGTEEGPANVLREKYDELKTEQIVYVRWKGEVCRLSVKGLSLRGKEGTTNFYQYISGRNDWYTHQTTLVPTEDKESGFYFLDFRKKDDLDEEQLATVLKNIKEIHEDCMKVKEDEEKRHGKPMAEEPEETAEPATAPEDYPEEELDASAIPF